MELTKMYTAGKISEEGLLNNLDKLGFQPEKCLSELVANSLEPTVKASRVHIKCTEDKIFIIDKGTGISNVSNMFNIYNQNHENDKSLGISGLGLKPATCILSERTKVKIYTHNLNNEYLYITIPWDKIFEEKKYTDMITCKSMNLKQKQTFNNIIQNIPDNNSDSNTGTIIQFNRTNTLYNVIESNFDPNKLEYIPIEDRLYLIYGLFKNVIFSAVIDNNRLLYLKQYNYFDLLDVHYYNGIMHSNIDVYEPNKESSKNKILFILVDQNNEGKVSLFEPHGSGYSKKITINKDISDIIKEYTKIGEITLTTGMRCDEEYENAYCNLINNGCICKSCIINKNGVTDSECPQISTILHGYQQYDKDHYYSKKNNNLKKSTESDYLCKLKIVRNNQVIGVSNIHEQTIGNARANPKANNNIFQTRCELSYQTISNQQNKMDKIFNIQANKNQYNENVLHTSLSRLVWHIKTLKHKDIWVNYFEKKYGAILKKPINEPREHIVEKEIIIDEIPNPEYLINNVDYIPEKEIIIDEIPNPEYLINNVDYIPEKEIIIKPKYTKIFIPHKNTIITVDQGIEILKKLKLNIDTHSDIINKMICAYRGNCAPVELIEVLNFMSNNQKYNLLIKLIKQLYNENPNRSSMKYGIELYNYSNIK
jgi:hypothetical protein